MLARKALLADCSGCANFAEVQIHLSFCLESLSIECHDYSNSSHAETVAANTAYKDASPNITLRRRSRSAKGSHT